MNIAFPATGSKLGSLFTDLLPLWRDLQEASESRTSRAFPVDELAQLREHGVLSLALPTHEGGMGLGYEPGTWPALLKLLRCLGYVSLPVARIYEGHVNALQLLEQYGTPDQLSACAANVREHGALSGVWNTDEHRHPTTLFQLPTGRFSIDGCKAFASGAGWITQPLLTGEWLSQGRQLIWLDRPIAPARIDPTSWSPMGMRETASYTVDISGLEVEARALVGQPGDYYREPTFSAGALRFVAAQLGAAERLLADTRKFLMAQRRHKDVSQLTRLSEMTILVETGRHWVESTGHMADRYLGPLPRRLDFRRLLTQVSMARVAVETICLRVMELVEKCIGARGLIEPQSFGRTLADLRMYLRQPFTDGALLSVGNALCDNEYPTPEPF